MKKMQKNIDSLESKKNDGELEEFETEKQEMEEKLENL